MTCRYQAGASPEHVTVASYTVTNDNRARVITGGNAIMGTTDEDTSTDITVPATDADGDTVTYTVASGPTHGTLSGTGATRTYTPAVDLHDGSVTPVCTPASASLFPLGTTTVSCIATDDARNVSAAQTFTVTVRDSSGPAITWVGRPQANRTYSQATLPAEPTCTATDASSPVTQCRVYGYSRVPGTHTLTARTRDAQGNSSVSTRTYTVAASAPTATPRPTSTPIPPRPTATPVTPLPTTGHPTAIPTQAPVPPTATTVPPTVRPTRTPGN